MPVVKIAVISDTHVPDRTAEISDELLKSIRHEQVDLILHAGDICVNRLLVELESIAPVKAVRGNRDFLLRKSIPLVQQFTLNGVKFAIMHGHINFLTYWLDKILYGFQGYRRERYIQRLPKASPGARVYVFGHTHHAENFWQGGVLFFNPGSVTIGDAESRQRTWGLLEVNEDGQVVGRIINCA